MSLVDADVDLDIDLDNAWNFIDLDFSDSKRGYQNCPRCNSVPECYAECNKDSMMEFTIESDPNNPENAWSRCKNKCYNLGGKWAFEFRRGSSGLGIDADVDVDLDPNQDIDADVDVDIGNDKPHPDRGCAMYRPNTDKCICVKGKERACKNIGRGMENCPNCGNSMNSAECLVSCKWEFAEELNDINDWDECAVRCNELGSDFRFRVSVADPLDSKSERGCAIYAKYDNNMNNKGKCVCVGDKLNACVNIEDVLTLDANNAPPAILHHPDEDIWDPETGASSYDMIEGYGIGVLSTLIILLIGIFIAYTCKWRQIAMKRAESVKYSKVINVDETTDDERVVIKK